jgi:hypothetical protein
MIRKNDDKDDDCYNIDSINFSDSNMIVIMLL